MLPSDRLRDALEAAFPTTWREILRRRVPFYCTLSEAEQERFEDKLQHFVLTKVFGGAGGLAITDEMKVVVAAVACRLTMNLPWEEYTHVHHVTLRPDESWLSNDVAVIGLANRTKVTLSWPNLIRDLAAPHDGNNVGYHEFAHALDGSDGSMDGEAPGPPGPHYAVWTQVIASARAAVRAGTCSLDPYAGKSEVEMFAVATEWFFERPHQLHAAMPAVYDLLRAFYRQDPGLKG